jgi:hypothetical protein
MPAKVFKLGYKGFDVFVTVSISSLKLKKSFNRPEKFTVLGFLFLKPRAFK